MGSVDKLVDRLRKMDMIHAFFIPTGEELESFFDREANCGTSSGMPMINLSLQAARERKHHIVIVQTEIIEYRPHHTITMVDSAGNTVGFDVPKGLEHEVEGKDDLVWLSDDFVLLPNDSKGEVSVVIHPYPITIFGEDEGVDDVVLMFPSPPVDVLIRETYGVKHTHEYNSAILSFNDINEYFKN